MSNIDKIAKESDVVQCKYKPLEAFNNAIESCKIGASLKHFPEFLLQEVKRLKLLDEEEELLYTKREDIPW